MTTQPGHWATVIDQPDVPDRDLVDDLLVEDEEVEVRAYPGVVRAGMGATVWAHAGVVVDAEDGAVVYLAPLARLEEWRPGALDRGTVQIIPWTPPDDSTARSLLQVTGEAAAPVDQGDRADPW